MTDKFTYTGEEDMSYGLTGMAMAMFVFDNQDMLCQISLDAPAGESITFSPDFFFCSNPRYSAKIAWNEMLKQYRALTALVMGNVLCRQVVYRHEPLTPAMAAGIFALVEDEGRNDCQLGDDEIHALFDNTLRELQRVISGPSASLLRSFATELRRRRTLSGHEVNDLFGRLSQSY